MNKRITYRISLLALLLLPIFGSCKKDRTIKPLSQLKSERPTDWEVGSPYKGTRERDSSSDDRSSSLLSSIERSLYACARQGYDAPCTE